MLHTQHLQLDSFLGESSDYDNVRRGFLVGFQGGFDGKSPSQRLILVQTLLLQMLKVLIVVNLHSQREQRGIRRHSCPQ